jgi:ATP-dependent RNA helicase SUPV3L1/SUV3
MFLGADTIRPLLRRLVPEAELITRPRFSSLTHAGERKLTRLPRRSAVVAFSAADVYEMAELLRRQRGGAAVVLGALSPRTRNAQVGMFQAGEVDYLVATDAIGMGLNMDIDHVAFARLTKFDGRSPRRLTAPEIAQIAGRAGRHMADGTFGTTEGAGPLDGELVLRVENHAFDPLRTLMWRSADLDFRSPRLLLRSLDARPPDPALRRTAEAEDHQALAVLAADAAILERAASPAATRLLWEVCQIPDFRKVLSDAHARLLARIFHQLSGPAGRLDPTWVGRAMTWLERTEGDIDALVARIAHIRTWTYISHRPEWLDDPRSWQERARAIEDRLSDALHARLTQRFVDRRSTIIARGQQGTLAAAVTADGTLLVEGEAVGRMEGLRLVPDAGLLAEEARIFVGAARRVLKEEAAQRVRRLEADEDAAFSLAADGAILWHGAMVARLAPGPAVLSPSVRLADCELVEAAGRERVAARLKRWLAGEVAAGLAPLDRLARAPLQGPARGIAFQLVEALGAVRREDVGDLVDTLSRKDRGALARLGVRLGHSFVFVARLAGPRALGLRALLWALAAGAALPSELPPAGRVSLPVNGTPEGLALAMGYVPAGGRIIRADRLEALAAAAAREGAGGTLKAAPRLAGLVAVPAGELPAALAAVGWLPLAGAADAGVFTRQPRRRSAAPAGHSPFARLKALGSA